MKILLFITYYLLLTTYVLYAEFGFMDDMIVSDKTLYDASVTDQQGEKRIGLFPSGTGFKTPSSAFSIKGSFAPGGALKTYSFIPAESEKKPSDYQTIKPSTDFYPFVSGGLDTSASRWYNDKVYLLVIKTQKKSVVSVLPYSPSFYECTLSARNGFENRFRKGSDIDIVCWGLSSQTTNPTAYFFLEPQKQFDFYRVFIQKEVDGKISEPILYIFRRAEARQYNPTVLSDYQGGLDKEGTASPLPSNRMRLKNE